MPDTLRQGAILLAAGAGSRFHGATHKLAATLGGRPLWHHAIAGARLAGLESVVVVTGAIELDIDFADADGGSPVEVLHTPDWVEGQAASLQAGLGRATGLGWDAAVIGLADQPGIPASAWAAVGAAPPGAKIVVATFSGKRGPHPVRLHRSVWPLLPTAGDSVARSVIASHPEWVVEVECVGSALDVDTTEDLRRWKSC